MENWYTEGNEAQDRMAFAIGRFFRRLWKFMLIAPIVARVGWFGFTYHTQHESFFFTEWEWLQGYVDSAPHQAFGSWLWWVSITIIGLWVFYRYFLRMILLFMIALAGSRPAAGQSGGIHAIIILGLFFAVGGFAFLLWEEYVAHFPSPPGWPTPVMGLELLLVFAALCVVGLWFCLLGAYVGIMFAAAWLWHQILYFLYWVWFDVLGL